MITNILPKEETESGKTEYGELFFYYYFLNDTQCKIALVDFLRSGTYYMTIRNFFAYCSSLI